MSDEIKHIVYSWKSPEFWITLVLMVAGLAEVLSWGVQQYAQGWKQSILVGLIAGGCYTTADLIVRCVATLIRRLTNSRSAQ